MRLLSFLLALAVAAPACRREAPDRSPEQVFGRLSTVAFAGDTVLARRMNSAFQEHGPSRPLEGVREVLAGADVAVVNLECILASGGEPADKGERNPYYFRGRPELVRILTEAGVDVASLANNHGGDYGPAAVVEGVRILREAGVEPLGGGENLAAAMAPVFQRAGDTVVAFVGADMTQRSSAATEDGAGIHFVSERDPGAVVERVREQVRLARRHAHLVLLVTHWGPNGTEEPDSRRRQLAKRLVREAGIDGVLGSSAHQLHGIEVIDGRPIIYDAGNLLFDYGSDDWTHKTAIFVLHLDRAGVRWVEAVPARMMNSRTRLASGEEAEEVVRRLQELSGRLGTKLRSDGGRAVLGIWDNLRARNPRESYSPPAKRTALLPALTSYSPPGVVIDELPPSATALPVRFEEGFELLGHEMPARTKVRHGVPIVTYWRAAAPTEESYQIFVHVESTRRGPPWRGDHQPGDWMYPTNRWLAGRLVRDSHQIRPPGESATGPHEVYVGLYSGRRRLAVLDGDRHDGQNRVRLGTIEVE